MARKLIRVVYVIGSLAIGGAETQLIRLVNHLDRDRFQPSVICLVEGGELAGELAPDVQLVKPHSPRGRTRIAVGRQALSTLAGELRRQKPDVVHAYLPAAYVPASLAAWSVRVPLIVAGRRGLPSGALYGTAWWRALARLANRVIDVQLFNSHALRQSAVSDEALRPDRTRVVHNGIDLPPLTDAAVPPELAWPGSQAVMVANFIAYKGHEHVLRAVAKVVEAQPDFRIVLIGEGSQGPALNRLTTTLNIEGNVLFAGRRKDAGRLMRGFDFSILGSSEESLPNAIIESMAVAVPVVATKVGGVDELIDDGVHGKLVPYGDVNAMSDAITWMIDHPDERGRMGNAGRQKIGTDFEVSKMVAETERVYEEFLAKCERT